VADRAARVPAEAHAGHAGVAPGEVGVATLTGPSSTPDRVVTLTAERDGGRTDAGVGTPFRVGPGTGNESE
jgi:hypothetical protein